VIKLTGQFDDKPTRGQLSRGLVNSQTSQLGDRDFFNHRKTTVFYTKPKPNTNCNPIA